MEKSRQTLKHDIWLAEAYISQAEANVAEQRTLIAVLEANGQNTTSAKEALADLEGTLRRHQANRDRLRRELDRLE
jgi:hypothetical protein